MAVTSMFLSPLGGRGRRRRIWIRFAALVLLIVLFVDSISIGADYSRSISNSQVSTPQSVGPKGRIFIATMQWNNERIDRSNWTAALLNLVRYLGADNVYVCIIESGSWDNTKAVLRELDQELGELGIERSIEFSNKTHADEIARTPEPDEQGWVWTKRGRKEPRRIPYLGNTRNQVMSKLRQLADGSGGQQKRTFDKVLWMNDVVYTTEDVKTLIATRDGDYAAACALDFAMPPQYYDTFALRDVSGAKAVTDTWPFFLAAESRAAMILNKPVLVKSCWNGMVVFQADPFYADPPLSFRGIPDSLAQYHLEGSECCLIHADNELSATRGVWLNPNVRVSYNPEADMIVNARNGIWPSKTDRIKGIWKNRLARWTGFVRRCLERYVVERRIRSWSHKMRQEGKTSPSEKATYCIINEMQVLREIGWGHL